MRYIPVLEASHGLAGLGSTVSRVGFFVLLLACRMELCECVSDLGRAHKQINNQE